jgi:ubiquinone/menaquinone biosynthesis C-methylase UbiE
MKFARKTQNFPKYIPTLNRMGYMSTLDKIQMAFVEHCENNSFGQFLDIGCGFGVAVIPVVKKKRRITACDLEKEHLEVLKKNIPEQCLHLVNFVTGHFPDEIKFPDNYFDGINLSMVLHFLPPHTIEKAFQEIYASLKKGGRLFLTTSSPYQRALASFIPLYEKRKSKEEWPGYISDIADYVPQRADLLPKKNVVFCIDELSRIASKFGFHVLEATFFSREGIPADLSLDGKEYSGIICEKPKDSSSTLREKNNAMDPTQAANMR